MANQEQLDMFKQRVEIWRQWRRKHSVVHSFEGADLTGADLYGADLTGADLHGMDLTRADLRMINFHRASLSEAVLFGVDLTGVDLGEADLRKADLRKADLSIVDLSGADLRSADLSGANLSGANFSGAWIGSTVFANVDLSQAKGLETLQNEGPSGIGIDTIYRSQGNIPGVFLQGAGVPDSFITYARSLVGHPIDYYSCFVSYSSNDEAFAKRLYAGLQSNGVRCWFAPEDLQIGDHYHQRIDESIRLYDKLVLILSEHAVQSAWVEREMVAAREKEDHEQRPVLFPLRLDDAVMDTTKAWAADVRRRWHIGDFTQWKDHDTYQVSFERLLRDLKAEQTSKD